MSEEDTIRLFLDELAKFSTHLPSDQALEKEIVILRGHLIIENVIRRLIDQKFVRPAAFEHRAVNFYSCVRIAEALFGDLFPDWQWKALKDFNDIRNRLSHTLEHELLDQKIKQFVQLVEKDAPSPSDLKERGWIGRMYWCIGNLHVEFAKQLGETRSNQTFNRTP